MRSRTIAGVLGACLAGCLAGSPAALAADPAPPAGCTDAPPSQQQGPVYGYDRDCVTLAFTAVPQSPTTDTSATVSWQVAIYSLATGSDWTTWRNQTCTLDGAPVSCAAAPTLTFTNLAVGEHVFTVSAETPSTFLDEPRSATVDPNSDCEEEFFSEGDFYSCVRVSGTVRWTVEAPPITASSPAAAPAPPAPVAAPPAPVVSASAPPAPKVCTSKRRLTIRLRERKGERIRSARVLFRDKTIATSRRTKDRRLIAKIDFRQLPSGRFSVKIRATYKGGKVRTYTRRYYTCKPKLEPSNRLESKKAI